MPRRAHRAPFWLTRDLKRDLIRNTALEFLAFRILEGAAAWALCATITPAVPDLIGTVAVAFGLYLVANVFLALRYRANRIPGSFVLIDVVVNLSTMVLATALTGGVASPLVLVGMMKLAGYGLVFSHRVAILALGVIVTTSAAIRAVGFAATTFQTEVVGVTLSYDYRVSFLALTLVGAVWLFQRIAAHDRVLAQRAAEAALRRALLLRDGERGALGRADDAHTETVVLAGVAETLSGFSETREILNKVVEIARGVLWWDYCFILLWDERSQAYYCSDVSGFDQARARALQGVRLLPADEPDLEWVRRLGHCAVIAPGSGSFLPGTESPALLAAPLHADGEFYGVLEFARRAGQTTFTTNDLRLADRLVARTVGALQRAKEQREQRQADRLAAAGELAAGVAHEVNNALTGILGQVESVRSSADVKALRGALKSVETQAHRISAIIEELLGFGRPQQPERHPVSMADLVRDTLRLMEPEFVAGAVRVDLRFGRDLRPVIADRKQIQQVLVNLFKNAIHAMVAKPGGEKLLRISMRVSRGAVLLEVEDTGTGIPEENLQRIFDPFFSTKKTGTGLGLSVSFNIIRAHGGDMRVSSQPNVGTRFSLRLPVATDHEAALPHSVLVVDDEPEVAASLEDMLVREGMTVRRAASGEEALETVAQEKFDAIFLDVRLPDISGQEVYARLSEQFPDQAARVIFVTGGLWRFDPRGFRDRLPPQPMLRKPCNSDGIREALRLLRDMRVAA